MDIQPTKQQQIGIDTARKMLATRKNRSQIMVLTGYGGTGKSTLLKFIAKELGHIITMAPTGKAALRITEATGLDSTTIHRWLYKPIEDTKTGEISFLRKNTDEITRPDSGLIVIDEASMVDSTIWEDIYNAANELQSDILLVGDPFQLPPVRDDKFSVLDDTFQCDYKVKLTEIHRQALESPIIRASMKMRKGDWVESLRELESVDDENLISECIKVVQSGGFVICHTNKTRHYLNNAIRAAMGIVGEVQKGEPLLILKNNYQVGVFNGEIVKFEGWQYQTENEHHVKDQYKGIDAETKFGRSSMQNMDVTLAHAEIEGRLDGFSLSALEKRAKLYIRSKDPFIHANFGYVQTCHKAQGSEADHVLVVLEDSLDFRRTDALRWGYTAQTRGKQSVKVSFRPALEIK